MLLVSLALAVAPTDMMGVKIIASTIHVFNSFPVTFFFAERKGFRLHFRLRMRLLLTKWLFVVVFNVVTRRSDGIPLSSKEHPWRCSSSALPWQSSPLDSTPCSLSARSGAK
jgi:hypothetical protein